MAKYDLRGNPMSKIPESNDLAKHYSNILTELGEDISRDGLVDTPKRAAKAMKFLTRGYILTVIKNLTKDFSTDDPMIRVPYQI